MSVSALQQALLTRDPAAHQVVCTLTQYRAAVRELLAKRYADGTICGADAHAFAAETESIEKELTEWTP